MKKLSDNTGVTPVIKMISIYLSKKIKYKR